MQSFCQHVNWDISIKLRIDIQQGDRLILAQAYSDPNISKLYYYEGGGDAQLSSIDLEDDEGCQSAKKVVDKQTASRKAASSRSLPGTFDSLPVCNLSEKDWADFLLYVYKKRG